MNVVFNDIPVEDEIEHDPFDGLFTTDIFHDDFTLFFNDDFKLNSIIIHLIFC